MANLDPRVEVSFRDQALMQHLGAKLVAASAGVVVIRLAYRPELAQQNGFVHAGASAAVMDSACGYAALTMADDECDVLTVEYKVNLMRPAVGEAWLATGRVVRAGRRISVCQAALVPEGGDVEEAVALMQATIMTTRTATRRTEG